MDKFLSELVKGCGKKKMCSPNSTGRTSSTRQGLSVSVFVAVTVVVVCEKESNSAIDKRLERLPDGKAKS